MSRSRSVANLPAPIPVVSSIFVNSGDSAFNAKKTYSLVIVATLEVMHFTSWL